MSPDRRVLVRLNSLELGGTQINAVDLAAALRAHGVESHLVGPRGSRPDGPSLLDVAAARGVTIEPYDPAPGLRAHARQLAEVADRVRADLVHVYGSWGGDRPVFWGPALGGRRPWVHTVYEMQVAPVVFRHVPLVVGTGYLLDEAVDRPGRTVLISPPVDTDADRPGGADGGSGADGAAFRRELGLADGEVLLGIVSRLDTDMKALPVEIAIDAVRHLGDGVTLAVVGTGDAEARLRERAAKVNAALGREAVRLLGPTADPRPAYDASDMVLGMGGSAARALAFGTPLVVQGEAGWSCLFEPATAEGLARNSYWSPDPVPDPVATLVDAVRPLLGDPARRIELGAFGREFALGRFGLPAMAERLAALYEESPRLYTAREWAADLAQEAGRVARKAAGRGTA
ncbi:glycosyltransferase family 4 protein [Antribacter gilvus]|uniref:glycosyltransferase family 4 protein n=1 Tax=Antribacter gilvus TaxID=2304675 RepID=UPI000F7A88C9|nr:glycosyltransferase family 4 protein [Antribacter gilvus]